MIDKITEYWNKITKIQKATLLGLFATGMILYTQGVSINSMSIALAVCLIGGGITLAIGRDIADTQINRFVIGTFIGAFIVFILSLTTPSLTREVPISFAIIFVSGLTSLASYKLLTSWSDWDIGVGIAALSSLFALAFTGILPISAWTNYIILLTISTAAAYLLSWLHTILLNRVRILNLGKFNIAYYPVIIFLAGVITIQLLTILPITTTAYAITTTIDTPITWVSNNLFMPALNWVGLGGINAVPMAATTNFEGTIFTTLEFEKETHGFTYNPAEEQSTIHIQIISPQAMAITPTEYVGNPIWLSSNKPQTLKKMKINLKADGMQVPVDILFNKQQATISSRYLRPSATSLTEGETSQQIIVKMPKGTFKVRFTAVSLTNEDAKIYASKVIPA